MDEKGQVYLSRPYAFVNVNFHLFWHASCEFYIKQIFSIGIKRAFFNLKMHVRSFSLDLSVHIFCVLMKIMKLNRIPQYKRNVGLDACLTCQVL